MIVKSVGWLFVGYLFGILGFGLAEFFDTFGEVDLITALVSALAEGIRWPLTLFELITGRTADKPADSLIY